MKNLNKRLRQAEQKTTPDDMPEISLELIDSRDQHFNREMYNDLPDPDNPNIIRLVPKPGYVPPDDPMEVNENPKTQK